MHPINSRLHTMAPKSLTTALTLYRARTLTLEQAATAGGCSAAQLEASARPLPGDHLD